MVSNVEKGRRLEKKARDKLIMAGYKIFFKSMRTRFGCQDFAKLFDIVAFKGKERRYVSVKTFVSNSRHKQHIVDILDFVDKHGYTGESFELWFWKEGAWDIESWIKR